MTDQTTPRFALPYLFTAQAQKETTHNEALAVIDALIHPAVEDTLNTPPASLTMADAGKCWRIGNAATGIWQNRGDQIASWTGGGWRYVIPTPAMRVFDRAKGTYIIFKNTNWSEPTSIVDPVQGNVVDLEARTAISAILQILRQTAVIPV